MDERKSQAQEGEEEVAIAQLIRHEQTILSPCIHIDTAFVQHLSSRPPGFGLANEIHKTFMHRNKLTSAFIYCLLVDV